MTDLLDRLDLAVTAGLLEERGGGYAFVHALARDAAATALTAARRMRVHDAAATDARGRLGTDPDTAATIAYHAHLAAPLGPEQADRASRWLARAASLAASRHAHAEALALWDQALADAPSGTEAAYDAHCGKAAALLRLARTAEAREETQRAARLGHALGRSDLVARAVGLLNGAGVWSWREHGRVDDEFVALLRDAAATGSAPRDEARLLAALQMELFYALDAARRRRGRRAFGRACPRCRRRRRAPRGAAGRALSLWGPGSAPVRLELLIRSCWRLSPVGEVRALVMFRYGAALFDCGRPQESDAAMRECAAVAAAPPAHRAWRSRWRGGTWPAPATATTRTCARLTRSAVELHTVQRLHRVTRAGEPRGRAAARSRVSRSPTRWWREPARATPRSAQ